jgi:hypothetical protein
MLAQGTVGDAAPWVVAALLGAYHGLNPGMGWLFAVFLGLQRGSGRVVALALLPIAVGHAASVALIAAIVLLAQSVLPLSPLRIAMALALLGFGAYRLRNLSRHGRWVGLNVGYRDLFGWSLLVATAHGSGLMLAPVLLQAPDGEATAALVAVHMLAMLVVMAATAWLVYARFGVAILKRVWINYDLLWAAGLLFAGALALLAALTGHVG